MIFIFEMTNPEKIIDFILKYENYIRVGNEYLQLKYNVFNSPLLAKNEGIIPSKGRQEDKNMSFNFHGMGCRFEFDKLVVDFDYSFGDFIYKGFEASKIFMFIESYLSIDEMMTKEIFDQSLLELFQKGIIKKIDDLSIDTYDYILI